MQSTRGKSRDSSELALCLEGTSPDPAALAAIRPIRHAASESRPKTQPHRGLILFILGVLLLLGLAPLRSAFAQNPFLIEGTVPDNGAELFHDLSGSVSELGPINGSSTKLGVIHSASPPMLGLTNPNNATDLVNIWLARATAADGDDWLYFAWERVATSGSSVIAYEFQQNGKPEACVYDSPDIDLINGCNPWSGRSDGDFMIVWDFKGGSTDIILRKFVNGVFDSELLVNDPNVSEAKLSGDTSKGEGAINLTDEVFPADPTECTTIGNIIAGTITGNSDSADYKDTVLEDFTDKISISNCGQVTIIKKTDPWQVGGKFTFSHNLDLLDDTSHTPFDVQASNQDGGSAVFSNVVVPGEDYFVQEKDPYPDFYLSLIECSDNVPAEGIDEGSRSVTFDLQRSESVTCTFTNTRFGKIVVAKQTDPDGSSQRFDFTADFADAPFVLADGESKEFDLLLPSSEEGVGKYSVSEKLPDGWEQSLASCDDGSAVTAVDVAPGETVTCTFTNTIKRGKILVDKVTNPAGSKQSFDFTLKGKNVDQSFSLTDAAAAHDSGDLLPSSENGTYDISETLPDGWDQSSATCDDDSPVTAVELAPGETVTCTFTNTIKRGKILVDKVTDPPGSDQSFDFTLKGKNVDQSFSLTDAAAAHDSGDLLPTTENGTYDVSETLPDGWDQSSASCDDGSPVTAVDLAPGETVTCTFNNSTPRGRIIVDKVTDPSGSDQSFDFTLKGKNVDQSFSLTDAAAAHDSGDLLPSSENGTYNVAETVPDGWDQSAASCDDGSSVTAVDLAPGETVTCTFTNTIRRGKILVDKVTDPAGSTQSFDFTLKGNEVDQSFSLTDTKVAHDSGDLLPTSENGTYDISETLPDGWDQSSASCDDGSPVTAVDLAPGETVTCTFTNTIQRGRILVDKVTKPAGSAQSFAFTLKGTGVDQSFALTDAAVAHDSGDLLPTSENGTYNVSETLPDGWNQSSVVCGDGSPATAVDLAPGETVLCTFTNIPETGAIKIVKTRKFAGATDGDPNNQPHDGVEFLISSSSLATPFKVTTDAKGEACLDGLVLSDTLLGAQTVGDYTVTEVVPVGYDADGDALVQPGLIDGSVVYEKAVSVDAEGSCGDNEAEVRFRNTPLTNVTVSVDAIDDRATKSKIECYQGTEVSPREFVIGDAFEEESDSDFGYDHSVDITNQLPLWEDGVQNGLIICTIKIDP